MASGQGEARKVAGGGGKGGWGGQVPGRGKEAAGCSSVAKAAVSLRQVDVLLIASDVLAGEYLDVAGCRICNRADTFI